MISYGTPEPFFLNRDSVRLAHFEAAPEAPQSPPLVLVNGWTGDHGIFTPQIAHFGQTRRVVAVDLRGHGASDAPEQEYTMAGFADDIAWQCAQLGLQKPVVIGHSFGGAVVLELCGRYPELASGMVMIDSIVMAHAGLRYSLDLQRLLDGIGGPNYRAVSKANAWEIGCDFDDPARRKMMSVQLSVGTIWPRRLCYRPTRSRAVCGVSGSIRKRAARRQAALISPPHGERSTKGSRSREWSARAVCQPDA